MSDTTTSWDVANARGDWAVNVTTLTRTPISVATAVAFGGGDGSTTQFSLVPPPAVADTFAAQIYRNDWQGNQLLYATARTNLLLWSEDQTSASGGIWSLTGVTVAKGYPSPDGGNNACRLTEDTSNGNHTPFEVISGLTSGNPYTYSAFVKAGTRTKVQVQMQQGANSVAAVVDLTTGSLTPASGGAWTGYTQSVTAVAGGYYKISVGANIVGSTAVSVRTFLYNGSISYVGDGSSYLDVFGGDLKAGLVPTAYIKTTSVAVSVTDYTLSPYGAVMLAVAPVLGAQLTWTGSYVLNVVSPGGDLQTGDDLATAILISLFTDRMAEPDDAITDGTNDPRGWWGDQFSTVPIGSRLWLLDRSKQTQETLQRAYDYIIEALQWLIDDGVVAKFDVRVEWTKSGMLGAQVIAYKQDGSTVAAAYSWAWQGIN